MPLLSTLFGTCSCESLILIQSSLATPWLPILHEILNADAASIVCICLVHPPTSVLPAALVESKQRHLNMIDWTEVIPGYQFEEDADWGKRSNKVCDAINDAPDGPVLVVIDAPEILCEDVGSPSKTYAMLKSWHSAVANRPAASRIILPLSSQSALLPFLIPPAFAPSIAHLILHSPSLVRHLSTDYLTPPPPHSPPTKFWPIFSSLAKRDAGERLVWGANGNGWGNEMVIEVLVRTANRKRTVEINLEGWRKNGVCELDALDELKAHRTKSATKNQQPHVVTNPTHSLPFNLHLTPAQQHSRAQVPLPYAHEGNQLKPPISAAGAIFYDPDSADDIDEDDPDEDLDI